METKKHLARGQNVHKLFDAYGEYIPGFFLIRIDKELYEGIGWENFEKEEIATLAHEYTHYLQDISTTRGINNFSYLSKILQLNFADAYGKSEIELPINIEKVADKEAYIESELQLFYQGNNEHKKIHHVNKIVREEDEIINLVLEDKNKLYAINLYYDDKEIPYTIGNDAIAESMAYVIEKNGFGASPRKNEFPYNICELVCEEYCEWILKKPNILVAICELALMHYHSGDMFWHIVKEIAEEKLFFTTVAEFEEYFLERTEFLYGNMKNDFGEVKDCLDFLYPSAAPLLEEINRKLGNMIFRGYEYRDKNKLFIAKILESTLPIQVMTFWMNYFGIPIIVDKKQNIYAGDDLAIMVGPFAMYNFFMQRSGNDCGLTALCYSQKIPNFKKDICNNSPWKQSEKKQLCIFGMYWHMYSLGGKTVRRKE